LIADEVTARSPARYAFHYANRVTRARSIKVTNVCCGVRISLSILSIQREQQVRASCNVEARNLSYSSLESRWIYQDEDRLIEE
jgi:hypothetical protein